MQRPDIKNISNELNYYPHNTSMPQKLRKEPGNPGCFEEIHKKVD